MVNTPGQSLICLYLEYFLLQNARWMMAELAFCWLCKVFVSPNSLNVLGLVKKLRGKRLTPKIKKRKKFRGI